MTALSHYAILYMDVLNQKEKLLKIDKIPQTEAEQAQTIELLRQTVGVIHGLSNWFDNYFAAAKEDRVYTDIPKAAYEKIRALTQSKIGKTVFSDSMLYYASLAQVSEAVPVIGMLHLIYSACAVMIGGLATKHPARGGLDVGILGDFPSGVYGPGLYQAYELENNVAQYPRVVVGQTAMNYLRTVANAASATPEERVRHFAASQCLSAITTDVDGVPMLDYCGQAMRNGFEGLRDNVILAKQFVDAEQRRFASEGNAKLATRYYILQRYLDSRMQLWT